METRSLNGLICGSDEAVLQRLVQQLDQHGLELEITTRLIDHLCFTQREWDFLLIDLDNLNSFIRSLLPAVCRHHKFSRLPVIGFSSQPTASSPSLNLGYGLRLDACLTESELPPGGHLLVQCARSPQSAP
ncbi:MAG: hypothetical protein KDJ97_36845 [Anaerolineae bacterium]|nr:hypothetical protein [Anaerolineae bacterium]